MLFLLDLQTNNLIVNTFCNSPSDATCCVSGTQVSSTVYLAIAVLIAMYVRYCKTQNVSGHFNLAILTGTLLPLD